MAAQAPIGDPAGSSSGGQTLYGSRAIRDLYPGLREDRLRYLERWGVIRPASVSGGERFYAFADLAALRHASAELARGVPFRSVVRDLRTMRQRQLADAPGAQLSFDFQPSRETAPAKVIALTVRPAAPAPADPLAPLVPDAPGNAPAPRLDDPQRLARAAACFAEGASLDTGDPLHDDAAMAAYRQAASLDPAMTAALVNLANIHYARDRAIEAEALYEKALTIDPSSFEAQYNLGQRAPRFRALRGGGALLPRRPGDRPDLRRRALLPGGHAREARTLVRRQAALGVATVGWRRTASGWSWRASSAE